MWDRLALAHTIRSQRWAKGAHDHGRAFHVSNDKATDEHVIARADGTAGLMFTNLELDSGEIS